MATIILPDHKLIQHPDIIGAPHGPTHFADGAMMKVHGDFIEMIFYSERVAGQAFPTESVMMTRPGFDRSLLIASIDFLPALAAGWVQ